MDKPTDIENSKNKTSKEIQLIKEKIINLLYWIFSIFMWFAIAGTIYRTHEIGIKTINYIQVILSTFFLIAFLLRKYLSYKAKYWVLLSIVFLSGASSILALGLYSQGIYFLLLATILTGVFINQKWGFIVFCASVLSIIIASILFVQNIIPKENIITNYSSMHSAWILAILIFSMVSWVITIIWQRLINFLTNKIEDISVQEQTLDKVNKLLSKEIESRKTAGQLLQNKIREIKIINKEYLNLNQQLKEANDKLEKSNIIINEAKQKAQAADKLKSSFLSNMSHEIRTPMNAIIGFASLIANENISKEEKNNYGNIIQSSTDSLLNTISDVINLAKIESGQFTLYPKIMDLDLFIDEIYNRYTQEIKIQKEDKIKLIIEKNITGNKIITDIGSLRQITSKLIENAIKFTNKGFVKIVFNLPKSGILNIQIQDSGIGMPKEISAEIFETFRQLDIGNTRQYGGVGIGLSISKGLIDLLNGTIDFISTPNKGSTFNIAIPIINEREVSKKESDYPDFSFKGKTILIVGKQTWDDRKINQFLQEINSVLIFVETGFQAIDTCKEHPEINLVIISINLPNMNSHEVSKLIKNNAPDLPIVVYLSEDKKHTIKYQQENGWDGFIESPIKKENFIKTISKILAHD